MSIGGALHRARTARNESQEEAAHVVGVHRNAWRWWEVGQTFPSAKNYPALAEYLGITETELSDLVYQAKQAKRAAKLPHPAVPAHDDIADDVVMLREEVDEMRRQISALQSALLVALTRPAQSETR